MKIILLQNIKKLGKKGDVKEVSDGFAKNYLIPKKIAEPAFEKNINKLEKIKEEETVMANKELGRIQNIAELLEGMEIEIPMKINEQNQLFASVTPKVIQEILKKKNFDISDDQINLSEPIKELGEFDAVISLDHNLEAKIKIIVTPEK